MDTKGADDTMNELELIINSLFTKQIKLCKTCDYKYNCGHTRDHIQDGCLRFYERSKQKYGNVAFFIDFRIKNGKSVKIDNCHFSFDFLCDYENKKTIQLRIMRELSKPNILAYVPFSELKP
jgi:hypothetical protein